LLFELKIEYIMTNETPNHYHPEYVLPRNGAICRRLSQTDFHPLIYQSVQYRDCAVRLEAGEAVCHERDSR